MEYNLHNFSTERLKQLLEEKSTKTQTEAVVASVEAIKNEIANREAKA